MDIAGLSNAQPSRPVATLFMTGNQRLANISTFILQVYAQHGVSRYNVNSSIRRRHITCQLIDT